MRSRYSAYVLKLEEYLLTTWHPDTRPQTLDLNSDRTRWLGLNIHRAGDGGRADATGWVSFTARCWRGETEYRLDERSRFVRQDGRWVYVEGEIQGA